MNLMAKKGQLKVCSNLWSFDSLLIGGIQASLEEEEKAFHSEQLRIDSAKDKLNTTVCWIEIVVTRMYTDRPVQIKALRDDLETSQVRLP